MNTQLDILLVEDNPQDAELTILALKGSNISNHIIHLTDGQQALDYLFGTGEGVLPVANLRPKVVLLDLKLPKVDGHEVLRQIRAHEQTKLIPVVVLTSSKEDRDVHNAYNIGANSYIVKPVDFEKFAAAISTLNVYWCLMNERPNY